MSEHKVYGTKEDPFDREYIESLGFKVTRDNGQYGKAESIRPKGKIILSWNRDEYLDYLTGEPLKGSFLFGVKEDGGTRTSFNGMVYNKEEIKFILNRII